VRKSEFIKSINLRWKNRISARNGVYEIKKLQIAGIQRLEKGSSSERLDINLAVVWIGNSLAYFRKHSFAQQSTFSG